jgi:hypothetical protein
MSFLSSLHSTARGFARAPGFFLITVLTLGLGIGATVAIFTVINAVLIRPLAYPEPERIVWVTQTAPGMGLEEAALSDGTYLLYRKENKVLEDLGIYWEGSVTLTGGGEPERVGASRVTPSIFKVLRAPAILGRPFIEEDGKPGAEAVTVLSHGLWQRRFGGDPEVLGSVIQVDGVPRRIVGVLAEGFHFPSAKEEIWTPMVIDPANLFPGNFNYGGVGRLRPGVTTERATKELSALVWRLPEALGPDIMPRSIIEQAKLGVLAKPFRDHLVGDIGRTL